MGVIYTDTHTLITHVVHTYTLGQRSVNSKPDQCLHNNCSKYRLPGLVNCTR